MKRKNNMLFTEIKKLVSSKIRLLEDSRKTFLWPNDAGKLKNLLNDEPSYSVNPNGGERYLVDCGNGYSASILKNGGSYGGNSGQYEVAVLDSETLEIVYTTEITNDVLGYLEPEDVLKTLDDIANL